MKTKIVLQKQKRNFCAIFVLCYFCFFFFFVCFKKTIFLNGIPLKMSATHKAPKKLSARKAAVQARQAERKAKQEQDKKQREIAVVGDQAEELKKTILDLERQIRQKEQDIEKTIRDGTASGLEYTRVRGRGFVFVGGDNTTAFNDMIKSHQAAIGTLQQRIHQCQAKLDPEAEKKRQEEVRRAKAKEARWRSESKRMDRLWSLLAYMAEGRKDKMQPERINKCLKSFGVDPATRFQKEEEEEEAKMSTWDQEQGQRVNQILEAATKGDFKTIDDLSQMSEDQHQDQDQDQDQKNEVIERRCVGTILPLITEPTMTFDQYAAQHMRCYHTVNNMMMPCDCTRTETHWQLSDRAVASQLDFMWSVPYLQFHLAALQSCLPALVPQLDATITMALTLQDKTPQDKTLLTLCNRGKILINPFCRIMPLSCWMKSADAQEEDPLVPV